MKYREFKTNMILLGWQISSVKSKDIVFSKSTHSLRYVQDKHGHIRLILIEHRDTLHVSQTAFMKIWYNFALCIEELHDECK